jgi:zinc protease
VWVYGLPSDYYTTLPDAFRSVTARQVQAAARTYLAPGRLLVSAAGDRKAILPQLRGLQLGPVEFRDADGNPR